MPDSTLNLARTTWKLPAKLSPVVFAFFMSGIMALLMCLVITATNRGLSDGYLSAVLDAYRLAMPVAFVCVMGVRPVVVRLVKLTVRS
ncbi:DUF2798 domain-containing protein [Pseudomonas fulva]|uniref:DUF2798 domain-containing protein n=1 Tax=Pseudomonadaceae TaxID=135621 RepID=UPI0008AA309A|nr:MULTISPECIES: DUF2798 domain-containing protein [Pseudomonas]UQY35331.1 DUF2798 domain-containing protein [Pseudomonas fulva]